MEFGKILKFALIGCGALGLVAFFMPLIHVKEVNAKASAWDVIKGLDKASKTAKETKDVLDKANKKIHDKSEELKKYSKTAGDIGKGAETAKYLFYIPFVPAALFILIGVIAVLRRFGRGSAVGALLLGLMGVGIWALIRAAAKDVGVEDALGSAMTMLAISYFGATAIGIAGLVKPEPEAFS